MALKDIVAAALNETRADNEKRRAMLTQVLAAAGEDGGDAAMLEAINRAILAHEQRAASFTTAGKADLAELERDSIGVLRGILRQAAPPSEPPKPAAKPKPEKAAAYAETATADEAKPGLSRRQTIIAASVVALLLAGAAAWFLIGLSSKPGESAGETAQKVTVYKDDMTLGNPKAPITLVEYAAPACPHCAHFNETAFPLLKKEYIETGKVFYVFRVYPIMPADGAVEAVARCLPADKYFPFIDLMFRNQAKWDPEDGVTDVRGGIVQLARVAGLNESQVDTCIANKDVAERINRIAQDAVTKYQLNGVPDIILNGVLWKTGGVEWPELKEKLDSMLPKQ
jgi:protein-disulfide isomerase